MIVSLSFKRVRRLLHRYVVPGLCASAIALGGCVSIATIEGPPFEGPPKLAVSPAADSATKEPMATVSMEPSIQVGDVAAVYVTVTNLRPDIVVVLQAHAVAQSGGRVDRLDVDHAIEKAGAADKLLAALGDRSFEVAAFPPAPELSGAAQAAAVVVAVAAVPLLLLLLPIAPNFPQAVIQDAMAGDKEKIEDKEFPAGPYKELSTGRRVVSYFMNSQSLWKGYLFFPRGSYSTLEITAAAIVPPETRCGWLGCPSLSAFDAVSQQILRGESLTLRQPETIPCPWRQQ